MLERQHATWGELLRDAVEKPGRVLEAYTAFHNYSFGNALLALEQCIRRNLQPGPLNTYHGWLERKRQVRKGEKGITLCMPMPFKGAAQTEGVQDDAAETQTRYAFRFRAYWFVLAQTEGEHSYASPIPASGIAGSIFVFRKFSHIRNFSFTSYLPICENNVHAARGSIRKGGS
jgi:antirestriction factor ArdC-like protein